MRAYRSLDIDQKLQIYEEVLDLRKRGHGYRRIQKIVKDKHHIKLNTLTIVRWIRGKSHPLGKYNRLIVSPELAYAVSAWIGDGSLVRARHYPEHRIILAVKDCDFAKQWGRCVAKALGKNKPYAPIWDKRNQAWIAKVCSKLLYDLLKSAKGDPWILLPYLEKYPRDACKGFFDAEGSVSIDDYEVLASNTDLRIIRLFQKLLRKIGIECNIRETHYIYRRNKRSCFLLAIHGKENILRFAEEVGFTIARKRARLAKILQKYNRTKIRRNNLEKCARALIGANLVRLDLVKKQAETAKLLLVSRQNINDYLRARKRVSKLLRYSEIEQLSREYFYSRSSEIIARVREILQAIIEMYGG